MNLGYFGNLFPKFGHVWKETNFFWKKSPEIVEYLVYAKVNDGQVAEVKVVRFGFLLTQCHQMAYFLLEVFLF